MIYCRKCVGHISNCTLSLMSIKRIGDKYINTIRDLRQSIYAACGCPLCAAWDLRPGRNNVGDERNILIVRDKKIAWNSDIRCQRCNLEAKLRRRNVARNVLKCCSIIEKHQWQRIKSISNIKGIDIEEWTAIGVIKARVKGRTKYRLTNCKCHTTCSTSVARRSISYIDDLRIVRHARHIVALRACRWNPRHYG